MENNWLVSNQHNFDASIIESLEEVVSYNLLQTNQQEISTIDSKLKLGILVSFFGDS